MWNAWTAPPGALPRDYDPWSCEAHCARCGELAQDCHCEDDEVEHMSCGPSCWTRVPCPECGQPLPPSGRSAPLEMRLAACCERHQHSKLNKCHLWNEHDSTRHFSDPAGWAAHEKACEVCRPDDSSNEDTHDIDDRTR